MAAPAPAQTNANKSLSLQEAFKKYFLLPIDKSLLALAPELGHLAPVILTVGAAIMGIISWNASFLVLAASSVEAHFIYNGIKAFGDIFVNPFMGISTNEKDKGCVSSFQTLTPTRFASILESGLKKVFPNQAMFFIAYGAAYLLQGMLFFNDETSELGPQYSNRPYLGVIGAGLFIVLFSVYLMAYSCDSFFSLILSVIFGALVGFFICYQNKLLFGKDAVNVMFIPSLRKKDGSLDYLCVKHAS